MNGPEAVKALANEAQRLDELAKSENVKGIPEMQAIGRMAEAVRGLAKARAVADEKAAALAGSLTKAREEAAEGANKLDGKARAYLEAHTDKFPRTAELIGIVPEVVEEGDAAEQLAQAREGLAALEAACDKLTKERDELVKERDTLAADREYLKEELLKKMAGNEGYGERSGDEGDGEGSGDESDG